MPAAPELAPTAKRALDQQLPWAASYGHTCVRFELAESADARWAAAHAGARIARGVPAGAPDDDRDDHSWTIDDTHPGHALVAVRGRLRVEVSSYGATAVPSLEVGSYELVPYPPAPSLPPDHPLIRALQTMRDGACVQITGHILGGYTTGHLEHDVRALACGRSFQTRIDALTGCDEPRAR